MHRDIIVITDGNLKERASFYSFNAAVSVNNFCYDSVIINQHWNFGRGFMHTFKIVRIVIWSKQTAFPTIICGLWTIKDEIISIVSVNYILIIKYKL